MKIFLLGLIPSIIIAAAVFFIVDFVRHPFTSKTFYEQIVLPRHDESIFAVEDGVRILITQEDDVYVAYIFTVSTLSNRTRQLGRYVYESDFNIAVRGRTAYFVLEIVGTDVRFYNVGPGHNRGEMALNVGLLALSINGLIFLYAKRRVRWKSK